jgi:hypothetical protein
MSHRLPAALAVLAVCLFGCADGAWRAVRAADDSASYSRFLREHGDSKYAPEAAERLAAARIRASPSREAFDAFLAEYPNSTLIAELRPYVEEHFFAQARMQGTASAYREFADAFPDGRYAARARGNAEYLDMGGFGGRLEALAEFAKRHPASDYAAEALRSVAAARLREESAFRRVGLIIEVPPDLPGAERLARVFAQRAAAAYQGADLELVTLPTGEDPAEARVAALLTISHHESPVRSKVRGGNVSQSGILARTTIELSYPGQSTPIWSKVVQFRAADSELSSGTSVVFGPGSSAYWSSFFIPVASWNTRLALREPLSFPKPPVAVEVLGSRAFVLFGDGDLQILEIGDPENPTVVAEYRRERDLARFEGLAIVGGRIAMYGPDGLEIVQLAAEGLVRTEVYARDKVGSIVGVEGVGDALLAASNRGLLWIAPGAASARTLLSQGILGLARSGDQLVFTDGNSLYVTTPAALSEGRLEGKLRMGRGFHPGRVHVTGEEAVVLGERAVAWVDLSAPSRPRVRSRAEASEVGEVQDAVLVGGRLFLLGPRGLQLWDPRGEHIVESADVLARDRLSVAGRHLVAIGDSSLQVVDATPFLLQGAAAAPR